jgi:hypothetical protein
MREGNSERLLTRPNTRRKSSRLIQRISATEAKTGHVADS